MKRMIAATGAALIALATPAIAEQPTVVIMQSLTGPAAFMGAGVSEGMAMAFAEANEKAEFGAGKSVRVLVEDDASDRTQALTLITRHANAPEVRMILGPTSGAVAIAGAELGNRLELPIVTLTNNLDIPGAGPWGFISTQPPRQMMSYLADFAADTRKVERCSTVSIKEIEVYVALRAAFEDLVREKGVAVVSSESVSSSDIDFSTLATKIAGQDIDCLFISAMAAQGGNIVRQLREAGLDEKVEIFGMNTFSSPEFTQTGGGATEGVYMLSDWVPGGFNDFSVAFAQNFQAHAGRAPDNWAALGYTIGRVAIEAMKAAGPESGRDAIRDALSATRDVASVIGSGSYSYVDDRSPVSGSNVVQIRNGTAVLYTE